jgi:acetoin utilization deacetylase AcuC-like enzyme
MSHNLPLLLFYRDEMAPEDAPGNLSKSPSKPRRFLEFLRHTPVWPHIEVTDGFAPVTRDDLLLAHEATYVDAFLSGKGPLAESNSMRWSPEFRDSVLLTNGCLLAAMRAATDDPTQVTMAPVSGFHHATPSSGGGFCTFSGQVVAGLTLYRDGGLRGAWIDMDGHYGNSIEDSREFAPDLERAIPDGCNVNPVGMHARYLSSLADQLREVEVLVGKGELQYVCVAHGADSHEWDQLGLQCTTAEWLQAGRMVYEMLARCRNQAVASGRRPVAVTLALFGGYRDDHPESVLGLHAMDTALCLQILAGVDVAYEAEVRERDRWS